MFRYEKDMIPVLTEHLSELYDTCHFIEEFSSGLGIADLVFTTESIEFRETLNDFESMHYISNYFNTIDSIINPNDLVQKNNLNKLKLSNVIKHLLELECVEDSNSGQFTVRKKYTPCLKNIYAIEAKLSNWRQGFFQAMRYKQYSNKSFLAISSEFIHRVDKALLNNNNIGLISVSPNQIDIIINPNAGEAENEAASYFLADNFAAKCHYSELEYCC